MITVQGEYKEAFEHFSRAYNISRSLSSTSRLQQLSRILSGVAHAHGIMYHYTDHINTASSRASVARLMDWKDSRHDEFDRPFSPPPAGSHSLSLYIVAVTCPPIHCRGLHLLSALCDNSRSLRMLKWKLKISFFCCDNTILTSGRQSIKSKIV